MEKVMIKVYRSSLITSVILMIIGLLLVFEADSTIKSISYIIGGILILVGLFAILKFIKNLNNPSRVGLDIIYGVVTTIFGTLIIRHPETIASIIPFIMGLAILFSSTNKLQGSFVLKNQKNKMWKVSLIVSIISAICGVVLIFNPFQGAVIITKIVGIFIIIYALLDIVSTITIKKNVVNVKNNLTDNIKEATIVEED